MNPTRLIIRLVLIVVVAVIFFARGGQHNPAMMKGVGVALVLAVVFTVFRSMAEAKHKKAEQEQQASSAGSKNVELFSKPKDF